MTKHLYNPQWHESIDGDNFCIHADPLNGFYYGLLWKSETKTLQILKLLKEELKKLSKFKKSNFSGYFKDSSGKDIKC